MLSRQLRLRCHGDSLRQWKRRATNLEKRCRRRPPLSAPLARPPPCTQAERNDGERRFAASSSLSYKTEYPKRNVTRGKKRFTFLPQSEVFIHLTTQGKLTAIRELSFQIREASSFVHTTAMSAGLSAKQIWQWLEKYVHQRAPAFRHWSRVLFLTPSGNDRHLPQYTTR